jgi:hypothetical protein
MPQAGEVYSYPDYVFPDGDEALKYVILLGQIPGGDWILGRTTSRQHGRPTNPQCNHSDHYPSFYLGPVPAIFPAPTWVVLDRLDDHDELELNRRLAAGTIQLIGSLTFAVLCDLLSCARGAEDVTQTQATAMSDLRADLGCP